MPTSTSKREARKPVNCFCFLSVDATYLRDVVKELEAGELSRSVPRFSISVPGRPFTSSDYLADFWRQLSAARGRIHAIQRMQTRARRERFKGIYRSQCAPLARLLLLLQVGLQLERHWMLLGGDLTAIGKLSDASVHRKLSDASAPLFRIEEDWRGIERFALQEVPKCFAKVIPPRVMHSSNARAVEESWRTFCLANHI